MRLASLVTALALGTALSAPLFARAESPQPPASSSPNLPAPHATEIDGYDGPEWWMVVGLACLYSVPVILFAVAFVYVSVLVGGRLRDDRGSGAWLDAAAVVSRRRSLAPPRGIPLLRF